MAGHAYGELAPTEPCPYCGAECWADFVDIGVGYTQCGPYHCTECRASEIGAYDEPREVTDIERSTGWYAPGAKAGSSANVIDGEIATHKEALAEYRATYPLGTTEHGRKLIRGEAC